jgi:hypothetical protein
MSDTQPNLDPADANPCDAPWPTSPKMDLDWPPTSGEPLHSVFRGCPESPGTGNKPRERFDRAVIRIFQLARDMNRLIWEWNKSGGGNDERDKYRAAASGFQRSLAELEKEHELRELKVGLRWHQTQGYITDLLIKAHAPSDTPHTSSDQSSSSSLNVNPAPPKFDPEAMKNDSENKNDLAFPSPALADPPWEENPLGRLDTLRYSAPSWVVFRRRPDPPKDLFSTLVVQIIDLADEMNKHVKNWHGSTGTDTNAQLWYAHRAAEFKQRARQLGAEAGFKMISVLLRQDAKSGYITDLKVEVQTGNNKPTTSSSSMNVDPPTPRK